jgi:hypothetical protein
VTNVHSLKDGERRTITESLEEKQEADAIDQLNLALNGVGVSKSPGNMGTSVQMIQEYYGKQATSVFSQPIRRLELRPRLSGFQAGTDDGLVRIGN